jgi:hypothetical protein
VVNGEMAVDISNFPFVSKAVDKEKSSLSQKLCYDYNTAAKNFTTHNSPS